MTPRNSTSDEALDLLPHLSLRRWICRRLREPSGSQPATTKQDTPSSVRASVRNTSECGTEKNHLCPTIDQLPSPFGLAWVWVWRRSDPPCFSVIAMPTVAPVLTVARTCRRSYWEEVTSLPHSAQRAASRRNTGMAEYVMPIGQQMPFSP